MLYIKAIKKITLAVDGNQVSMEIDIVMKPGFLS